MPNINRPSLKHKTNFKTKDGDRWLPFEDDAQINQMIEAFMVINSKVIWNKTILKSCNRAFCNLVMDVYFFFFFFFFFSTTIPSSMLKVISS